MAINHDNINKDADILKKLQFLLNVPVFVSVRLSSACLLLLFLTILN